MDNTIRTFKMPGYVEGGRLTSYGWQNNKLCFYDHVRMVAGIVPNVDDSYNDVDIRLAILYTEQHSTYERGREDMDFAHRAMAAQSQKNALDFPR